MSELDRDISAMPFQMRSKFCDWCLLPAPSTIIQENVGKEFAKLARDFVLCSARISFDHSSSIAKIKLVVPYRRRKFTAVFLLGSSKEPNV